MPGNTAYLLTSFPPLRAKTRRQWLMQFLDIRRKAYCTKPFGICRSLMHKKGIILLSQNFKCCQGERKMKIRIFLFAFIAIILLLSVSYNDMNGTRVYSSDGLAGTEGAAAGNSENSRPEITVESPMTLSNSMCAFNGQNAYLRLKMVKGRYYEDWNPGAIMGTLWEGSYVIELADESGRTIAETDISRMYNEPLLFRFSFAIEFDDYNDDGDPDFTIGQYASSNGRLYRLFTLRKTGKVEQLQVKDHPDLFISDSTGYYSTKLEKVDAAGFQTEYYNNAEGTFREIYHWEDGQFVLVKSYKMTGEDTAKDSDDVSLAGDSASSALLRIHMIDAAAGWALNENEVFHTQNGGQSWQEVTPELTGLVKVGLDGYFTDAKTGWVVLQEDGGSVGNQGATSTIIFYTSDAGLSWNKSVIPSYNIYTSMAFADSDKGWILLFQDAGMGKQKGELYRTEDGGKTWMKVSDTSKENGLPLGGWKNGISFSSNAIGWLTGSTGMGAPILHKTVDGGKTWGTQLDTVGKFTLDTSSVSFPPIFFNDQEGILPISTYTGQSDNCDNLFYSTHDGGKSWEAAIPVRSKERISSGDFDFINLKTGWAMTYEGILYRTGDGGKSWAKLWENTQYKSFSCLDFVSEETGWALADGKPVKTIDGGKSWSEVQ